MNYNQQNRSVFYSEADLKRYEEVGMLLKKGIARGLKIPIEEYLAKYDKLSIYEFAQTFNLTHREFNPLTNRFEDAMKVEEYPQQTFGDI